MVMYLGDYDFILKPYLSCEDIGILVRRAKRIGKSDKCKELFTCSQAYLGLKKSDIVNQVFYPSKNGTTYIPTLVKQNEREGRTAYNENLYEELVTGEIGNFEVV